MHALQLDPRSLAADPKKAIDTRRGTPLSEQDLVIIDSVIVGPEGAQFDRQAFSSACLFQAELLGRIGSGTLFDMGDSYIRQKPSLDDAQAALVFVQQGTRLLRCEQRDCGEIARIAAAFVAAGHNEIALEMLKCVGLNKYLTWHDKEELTLPPRK